MEDSVDIVSVTSRNYILSNTNERHPPITEDKVLDTAKRVPGNAAPGVDGILNKEL